MKDGRLKLVAKWALQYTSIYYISPESWQTIRVLAFRRSGLRWRTCQPPALQGAVVQDAVAKFGKGAVQVLSKVLIAKFDKGDAVQGARHGAVQSTVAKFGKNPAQDAVQGGMQGAVQGVVHYAGVVFSYIQYIHAQIHMNRYGSNNYHDELFFFVFVCVC